LQADRLVVGNRAGSDSGGNDCCEGNGNAFHEKNREKGSCPVKPGKSGSPSHDAIKVEGVRRVAEADVSQG
jgi:hypothetical protein